MASVELDLDDDYELRARSMQGVGPAHWQMPFIPIETPKGLSSLSSIGSAEYEPPVPQHRPSLPAPQTHIMYRLLPLHNETERLTRKSTDLFDRDITQSMAEIDKLSLEKEEALKNEAEATKARASWSTLAVVSTYITSISAMSLGYAVGGLPGLCIGAGGCVGVTHQVLRDTHLLQVTVAWYDKSEEQQKRITQNIEMGAFYLQMGHGLAGGVAAWQTGAFASIQAGSTLDMVRKASSLISTTSGIATAGFSIGAQLYNKRILDMHARAKELDTYITSESHNITQETSRIRKTLEADDSEVEQLRKAIYNLEVSQG